MLNQALSGIGVGLRGRHVPTILDQRPDIAWFELLTDNHLAAGGALRFQAEAIAAQYPVALHGVNMNIAGFDPIDINYIDSVKALANRFGTKQISDHLAVTAVNGQRANDLLVFPRTEAALQHIVNRVVQIQERLQQAIIIENASAYIEFTESEISEMDFLSLLAKQSGCGILLDVNNVYVSAHNLQQNPIAMLDELDWQYVQEMHLAGHTESGSLLIDTHIGTVAPEVLELYAYCVQRIPNVPTLFEWDKALPEWQVILHEAQRLRRYHQQVIKNAAALSA